MKTLLIDCGNCKTRFSAPLPEASVHSACPACETGIRIEVFPALFKKAARGKSPEAVLVDDESSCFYHPAKKAAVACEGCGRFLCALCDVDWGGKHLCAVCIESGVQKGRIGQSIKEIVYYDNIALAVAIVPLLIFYFTLVTAPIAIYIVIRYWNAPMSAMPRSKLRFVIAALAAVLQIAGWGVFFISLLT